MWKTGYNGTDSPVVVEAATGRSLGGGEWSPVLTTDEAVKAAVDGGSLVFVEDDGGDLSGAGPEPRAAIETTRKYADRSDQLKDLDKATLQRLAVRGHLVEKDDDVNRDELELMLVRSEVDLTRKKPSGK